MTGQSTLLEVRKTLEERVEYLRRLQHDKLVAPSDRQAAIQAEIDATSRQIVRLDTRIQELIRNPH